MTDNSMDRFGRSGDALFQVLAQAQSCPAECSRWFDGCNTCSCLNGRVVGCTKMFCPETEPPRCLDSGAGAAST